MNPPTPTASPTPTRSAASRCHRAPARPAAATMAPRRAMASGLAGLVVTVLLAAPAAGQGFTYAGHVELEGLPFDGTCDFEFALFASSSGGTALGSQTVAGVAVTDGDFAVVLNELGELTPQFDAAPRFLEIALDCPVAGRGVQLLDGRQQLRLVPRADFADLTHVLDSRDVGGSGVVVDEQTVQLTGLLVPGIQVESSLLRLDADSNLEVDGTARVVDFWVPAPGQLRADGTVIVTGAASFSAGLGVEGPVGLTGGVQVLGENELVFFDATDDERTVLGPSGLVYFDATDDERTVFDANRLVFFDATDDERTLLTGDGLEVFDATDDERTVLAGDRLVFFDATDDERSVMGALGLAVRPPAIPRGGAAPETTYGSGGIAQSSGPFSLTFGGAPGDDLVVAGGALRVESDRSRVGILVGEPTTELDVGGGLRIADTTVTAGGVMRFTGSDFEGHDGSAWRSLTAGGGLPGGSAGDTLRHDGVGFVATSNLVHDGTRVGIGDSSPAARLDVDSGAGLDTAIRGDAEIPYGFGVLGISSDTLGEGAGVRGEVGSAEGGAGVHGLATAGTGAAAGVRGESSSDDGPGVLAISTATTGTALRAEAASGDLLVGHDGVEPKFRVEADGDVFADGSFNCGLASGCFNAGAGADLAERIEVSEELGPGDVVEIDPRNPGRFRLSRGPYSPRVAGVVSSRPGITLNNDDLADNDLGVRTDDRPLLALVGQVPVKATAENGPIAPGDHLVSATLPGHAMRCAEPARCLGAVIGKALEPLSADRGEILILTTLR